LVALAAWLALCAAGLWWEDDRRTRRWLALALAAMAALPLGAGLIAPIAVAHQRYWMAALPLAVVVAARGWSRLPAALRIGVGGLLVAAYSLCVMHYFTDWEKGNVRQAAAMVQALAEPGAAVIVPRYMQPLWRYYDRSGLPLIDETGIDRLLPALEGRSAAIFVTLDVPNPVLEAMGQRYPPLVRRRWPAGYHLGLVMTLHRLGR
jgi:hypothetical protein